MSKSEERIVYPDYTRNSVNIVASILEGHGLTAAHTPLPSFSSKPIRDYSHVFFMVFDGMGHRLLLEKIPGIERRAAKVERLTSVFPSTTTAAVTSLLTGQTPLEHGYLGWTLYMKEYNSYINALVGTDADAKVDYHALGIDYHDVMAPEGFLSRIRKSCPDRKLWYAAPKEFGHSFYTRHTSSGGDALLFDREQDLPDIIRGILKQGGPSTSLVYSPFPDYFGHREGLSGPMFNGWFSWFDGFINELQAEFRGKNALVLISADHGLIDMDDYFRLDQDKALMDTLIIPPFPESRFCSFFVKEHMKRQFEERFHSLFDDDFLLLERGAFLSKGLLGTGNAHPKVDDFIGNYAAIATGRRGIHFNPKHNPDRANRFVANHAGLTDHEMEVPLIVLEP